MCNNRQCRQPLFKKGNDLILIYLLKKTAAQTNDRSQKKKTLDPLLFLLQPAVLKMNAVALFL